MLARKAPVALIAPRGFILGAVLQLSRPLPSQANGEWPPIFRPRQVLRVGLGARIRVGTLRAVFLERRIVRYSFPYFHPAGGGCLEHTEMEGE